MVFREPEKSIFFFWVTVHMRPPTSDGHKFIVRTLILVFLNSMESPLSLESINI